MNTEQIAAFSDLIKNLTLSGFAILALAIVYRDAKAERTIWLGIFTKILDGQFEQLKIIQENAARIEELRVQIDDQDAARFSHPPIESKRAA